MRLNQNSAVILRLGPSSKTLTCIQLSIILWLGSVESWFDPEELVQFRRHAVCFQQRSISQANLPKFKELCGTDMVENFCDNVQCEPTPVCRDGTKLVPNVVGHGCCPACVKFLEDGKPCKPGLKLEQCENGLVCKASKGRCDVPRKQRSCLIEFHNRNVARKHGKMFYVKQQNGRKYIQIEYNRKLQLPICSGSTGDYEIKQQTLHKAYCVRADSGQPTFGLVDIHQAVNLTCKCADSLQERLKATGYSGEKTDLENGANYYDNQLIDRISKANREHFADTHVRCQPSGNFAKLQCINETCLCVDEKSGAPLTKLENDKDKKANDKDANDNEKISQLKDVTIKLLDKVKYPTVANFGAQFTMACFDKEKSTQIGSKMAEDNFIEACQQQKLRSASLEKHFALKGTTIVDKDQTACDFDDRFRRVQCKNDICKCVNPEGSFIGSYGASSSDIIKMDCRCALEEYLVEHEKRPFEKLPCTGNGNFVPYYCSGSGACTCSDENGTPISEPFQMECTKQFLRTYAPNYEMLSICSAMATAVSNVNTNYSPLDEIYYDKSHNSYTTTLNKPDENDRYTC